MNKRLLSFGKAVEAAKKGKKVARIGWNGAGMFAYIVPAASYPAQTGVAKEYWGENPVPYREYWALKTAQEDVAVWAPSGSDSLAEDWIVLGEEETVFLPHQQRVVDEKIELDKKRALLDNFIGNNPIYKTLSIEEQFRLSDQYMYMSQYSEVLTKRIGEFLQ